MTRFASATIAAFLIAGPAVAADMPVKALRAPPIVAYDWSGFYLGVHAGYGVARDPFTTASAFTNANLVTSVAGDSFRMGPAGGLAGVQAGYNWQFAPSWVAGVEADWSWTDQNDSACVFGCFTGLNFSPRQKLDWLSTVRGRLGYSHDKWLWYVTGGGAWGRVNETDSFSSLGTTSSTTFNQTRSGWTAGVGVEAAIAGNWTAKLEYLYVDLGSGGATTFTHTGFGATEVFTVTRGDFRDNIVRLGLNYRFAGPAQAAAASQAFAAATHNWTGFYLGGNAGYSVGRNSVTSQHFNFPGSAVESFTLSPAGAVGGGQFGYNWQIARNWVLGAEIDGQWAGQKDSSCTDTCNFVPQANAAAEVVSIDQQLRWLATARGRVGYTTGDWLAYVTGGAAWGGIHDNYLVNVNGISTTAQNSQTKGGWTVGTGIETALAGHWTAKLEYLYVDLGTVTDVVPNAPLFGSASISTAWRDHIVRFGVNYSFGGPNVVVAKY